MLILKEEPLSDPLVHNDHSDARLLLGHVVGLSYGLAQLIDFLLKHLASHGITNTVTVYDEVLWIVTMSLLEAPKGSLDSILELLVDNLLAFALSDAL